MLDVKGAIIIVFSLLFISFGEITTQGRFLFISLPFVERILPTVGSLPEQNTTFLIFMVHLKFTVMYKKK